MYIFKQNLSRTKKASQLEGGGRASGPIEDRRKAGQGLRAVAGIGSHFRTGAVGVGGH